MTLLYPNRQVVLDTTDTLHSLITQTESCLVRHDTFPLPAPHSQAVFLWEKQIFLQNIIYLHTLVLWDSRHSQYTLFTDRPIFTMLFRDRQFSWETADILTSVSLVSWYVQQSDSLTVLTSVIIPSGSLVSWLHESPTVWQSHMATVWQSDCRTVEYRDYMTVR